MAFASPLAAETESGSPDPKQLPCGGIYTVAEGDWLHKIAVRAYGEPNYLAIYHANRDVLREMSSVAVGVRLLIPCLDGTGPQNRAEAAEAGLLDGRKQVAVKTAEPAVVDEPAAGADEFAGTSEPVPDPEAAPVAPLAGVSPDAPAPTLKLLAANGFAPFTDTRLPQGGMVADLVARSLAEAAPDVETELSFSEDWSEQLRLLEGGAHDIGFPWYKPDCARKDRLTGAMLEVCSGFVFSKPLFEVAMQVYVRAGDELAQAKSPKELLGKRVCRPAGYVTFDLEQARLMEPNVTRVIPPRSADCFAWLARGDVDAVSVRSYGVDEELVHLGLKGRVVPASALASTMTLHAIAPAEGTQGHAFLDFVNAGVSELQMEGGWFEIVASHLGAYAVSSR